MTFIEETLKGVHFPKIVKVEQCFDSSHIENIEEYIKENLLNVEGYNKIKEGQSVVVTAGSRGIHGIDLITRTVCQMVKEKGAHPFIVPAMGSHGGATAEGQLQMLETLGITEEKMGVPIKSSMQVVKISELKDGRPVYLDKYADEADGIILINRIKDHTSFKGDYESGLMKMMAIGLGKQTGAENYHKTGFKYMPKLIEEAGQEVLNKKNIFFGVAVVENGYGKISEIAILNANEIPREEKILLKKASQLMPKLFFKQADVLIVKEIGKNISGTGMDSNITGRFNNEHFKGDVDITKISVLDLTEKSHGNFNGLGLADFTTKHLYEKMDWDMTYPNALTSTTVVTVKIPMILATDKMAIQAAIKTCNISEENDLRFVIIENTKNMKIIYISENMAVEAKAKGVKILSEPLDIPFFENGSLNLDFI